MKEVFSTAIIGAGPAGSTLAMLLAERNRDVTIFHDPGAPEKHCAGGIPFRSLELFPWLKDLEAPSRGIRSITLVSPSGIRCDLRLCRPITLYERASFDAGLRAAARRAGARFIEKRARSFRKEGGLWVVVSDGLEIRSHYLVGADGATSIVRRRLSRRFTRPSMSLCAGYYLEPVDKESIFVGYLKRKASYAWIFPRPGLASTGIGAPIKGANADSLRSELREWLERLYPGHKFDYSRPYASLVSTYAGAVSTVSGDGWALVGDAAGVADPVTREGIFFSMVSAKLLADSILEGHPETYGARFAQFMRGSHRFATFLRKYAFRASPIERMFWLLQKSASGRAALEEFFSGSLDYVALAKALAWAAAKA